MFDKFEQAAKNIKNSKFFAVSLSDNFHNTHLDDLMFFIEKSSLIAQEDKFYHFIDTDGCKAEVNFWNPINVKLDYLTLGSGGDLGFVDITGLAKEQIKGALINAAGAFSWNYQTNIINIIVAEVRNGIDIAIDIGDAIFGTEYVIAKKTWSRYNDGLFIAFN